MTDKLFAVFGGLYASFAIITFMVAVESSPTNAVAQTQHMAQASQIHVVRSERLDQSNPRRDLWLTIWTVKNCYGCELQKREVPALEKAGYNVIIRRVPAPRWVKSFPTTVVTRGSHTGKRITTINGFKTLAEIDSILKVAFMGPLNDPKKPEIPDYNIFSGFIGVQAFLGPGNLEQEDQLRRLERFGVSVTIFYVRREGISVMLISVADGEVKITKWHRYITADEILNTLP